MTHCSYSLHRLKFPRYPTYPTVGICRLDIWDNSNIAEWSTFKFAQRFGVCVHVRE